MRGNQPVKLIPVALPCGFPDAAIRFRCIDNIRAILRKRGRDAHCLGIAIPKCLGRLRYAAPAMYVNARKYRKILIDVNTCVYIDRHFFRQLA